MKNAAKYILITPAYNEECFIEDTIKSVIVQSILPQRWIIVDDGSTDNTAEIVKGYARSYEFIEYHYRERVSGQSYYGSNVYAILEGYESLKGLEYGFLAILDADMELSNNYYEEIFKCFKRNPRLGIGTGVYLEEVNGVFKRKVIDRRSTPKAFQVFRRECYEQIGGYIPFKNGGEDSCTEVMARMRGWWTWSFPHIEAIHNRPGGMGEGKKLLHARFKMGITEYSLAVHPVFMLFKCLRRCFVEKPYLLSGFARFSGFVYGYIRGEARQIPSDVQRYLRKEQMKRLLSCVRLCEYGYVPDQP